MIDKSKIQKPVEEDHFLVSGCVGEVIRVSEGYSPFDSHGNTFYWNLYLSFYNSMFSGTTGWRQRLRHVWHIITTGTPWKDEVLLELEQAKILRNTIDKMIKRAEKYKVLKQEK